MEVEEINRARGELDQIRGQLQRSLLETVEAMRAHGSSTTSTPSSEVGSDDVPLEAGRSAVESSYVATAAMSSSKQQQQEQHGSVSVSPSLEEILSRASSSAFGSHASTSENKLLEPTPARRETVSSPYRRTDATNRLRLENEALKAELDHARVQGRLRENSVQQTLAAERRQLQAEIEQYREARGRLAEAGRGASEQQQQQDPEAAAKIEALIDTLSQERALRMKVEEQLREFELVVKLQQRQFAKESRKAAAAAAHPPNGNGQAKAPAPGRTPVEVDGKEEAERSKQREDARGEAETRQALRDAVLASMEEANRWKAECQKLRLQLNGASHTNAAATAIPATAGAFAPAASQGEVKLTGELRLRLKPRHEQTGSRLAAEPKPATTRRASEPRDREALRPDPFLYPRLRSRAPSTALHDEAEYAQLRAALLNIADERDRLARATAQMRKQLEAAGKQSAVDRARSEHLEKEVQRMMEQVAHLQAVVEKQQEASQYNGDIQALVRKLSERADDLVQARAEQKAYQTQAEARTQQLQQSLAQAEDRAALASRRLAEAEEELRRLRAPPAASARPVKGTSRATKAPGR